MALVSQYCKIWIKFEGMLFENFVKTSFSG